MFQEWLASSCIPFQNITNLSPNCIEMYLRPIRNLVNQCFHRSDILNMRMGLQILQMLADKCIEVFILTHFKILKFIN